LNFWYDSLQKGGTSKRWCYTWWNFVPTNTGLVKDGTTHNVCVCASTQTCQKWCYAWGVGVHQYRLVKTGAMLGVWVCTLTQTLSKMAYRHMGLCVCVCVRERERERERERAHQHGLGNCNSKWANPPWGLGFNPKLNRKLFPDHLPSIFHGVLVGAGLGFTLTWRECLPTIVEIRVIPHCPRWFLGQVTEGNVTRKLDNKICRADSVSFLPLLQVIWN
jgi:hypothetical protein